MINLKDKLIVVTGASSGIGRSTAKLCASLGARVALVSRNEEKLITVKNELEGDGHDIFICDLFLTNNISSLITSVCNKMGRINGLVYAAGMEYTRPLKVINNKKLEDVYKLNVFSAIEMAKEITKRKHIGENSSLIFISSIVGILGEGGKIGYASSKGALIAAAKSMAIELAPRNIRVNTILPALVETQMSSEILSTLEEQTVENIKSKHPLGFGKPEDIANSIVFLLSDKSSWITGVEFVIDGGFSAS